MQPDNHQKLFSSSLTYCLPHDH